MSETTETEPGRVLVRRRCRACGRPLAFVVLPSGRAAPMEVAPDGTVTDVNHFATCPQARRFSRRPGGRA